MSQCRFPDTGVKWKIRIWAPLRRRRHNQPRTFKLFSGAGNSSLRLTITTFPGGFTMRSIAICFVLALALSSCIHPIRTQNLAMQSWVGHSRGELVSKWGSPSSVVEDGLYQMFVYAETETNTTVTPPTVLQQGGKRPPLVISPGRANTKTRVVRQRIFWLDADGIVRKWSWKGL